MDITNKAELFMHAVSSDEEEPTNLLNTERFDPKLIRKRIRKQMKRNKKLSLDEYKYLKKRTKKIIRKIKSEAFE